MENCDQQRKWKRKKKKKRKSRRKRKHNPKVTLLATAHPEIQTRRTSQLQSMSIRLNQTHHLSSDKEPLLPPPLLHRRQGGSVGLSVRLLLPGLLIESRSLIRQREERNERIFGNDWKGTLVKVRYCRLRRLRPRPTS